MQEAQPEKHEAQMTPPVGLPMYPVEHEVQVVKLLEESVQTLQAMLQGSQYVVTVDR